MPTVRYEVIGEHSAPGDFETYILIMLANYHRTGKLPHFVAKQIESDEIAVRRGSNPEIEFDLVVHATDHTGFFSVRGNICMNDVRSEEWILIEATDRVRFDVIN